MISDETFVYAKAIKQLNQNITGVKYANMPKVYDLY